MIRKYHRLTGTLTAMLAADSTVMQVNRAMATAIAQDFENGTDSAYFAIATGGAYEVVRVTGVDDTTLSIERAQDGTTASPFPIGATLAYIVTVAGVLEELYANGAGQGILPDIYGQGIADVERVSTTEYNVTVPQPVFTGQNGIEVIGAWPNIRFVYTGGECCGGETEDGGGGTDLQLEVEASGIVDAYAYGSQLFVGVQEPQFSGQGGIEIEGSWPYITFRMSGGVGSGTVGSVAAGPGLLITGNPNVNPTISMANTGVQAGAYGDMGINSRGQITSVPADFLPVSYIRSQKETLTVTRLGWSTYVLDAVDAAVGVPGVVALADSGEDFDPNNDTEAATPAVVAKALATFAIPEVEGVSTFQSEADGDYTNILGASAVTLQLDAGEKALVIAETTARSNTTPSMVLDYGLAVFNSVPAKVRGGPVIHQNQQHLIFVLDGPINTGIGLATTALPSGSTIVSYSLTVVKF